MTLESAEFRILESLTRQTDYRGLCGSLLDSLHVLFDGSATLLEVYDDRGHTSWGEPDLAHLVIRQFPSLDRREQPDWLAAALQADPTNYPVLITPTESKNLLGLGGLNGIWRFVELDGALEEDQRASIVRIVAIFANLMRLIDRFERDPLTGLLNRQSFEHRFDGLHEYQQRNPEREQTTNATWMAIVDIDHFKSVNDSYGHLFGDEILLLVSQIMRQSFRFDDFLFRYGGEEFIIILRNTDELGAQLALERFRVAVASYDFPRLEKLTVSVGWSAVTTDEFSNDIIFKADKALYYAKDNGRDQVIRFEDVFAVSADSSNEHEAKQ